MLYSDHLHIDTMRPEEWQKDIETLKKALEIVCEQMADHLCPEDYMYDSTGWDECKACPRDSGGLHCREEQEEQDAACWKRWALEKAEQTLGPEVT